MPAIHDLFEGLGRSISDWMDDVLAESVAPRRRGYAIAP